MPLPRIAPLWLALLFAAPLAAVAGGSDRCKEASLPWQVQLTLPEASEEGPRLRVVTYNLHSGLGGGISIWASRPEVERNLRSIARDIASVDEGTAPDVIALTEVDFGGSRSGGIDQAEAVREELFRLSGHTYHVVKGEAWTRETPGLELRYGTAALVRHPVQSSLYCRLEEGAPCAVKGAAEGTAPLVVTSLPSRLSGERRGVLKVTVRVQGAPVDVLVLHLEAFAAKDREAQAAHALRRFVTPGRTTVIAGDMNAVPRAYPHFGFAFANDWTHDVLSSHHLADARYAFMASRGLEDLRAFATFPSARPQWPLDHIYGTADLLVEDVRVLPGKSSDHRGLFARYELLEEGPRRAQMERAQGALRRAHLERFLACDLRGPPAERAARALRLARTTGLVEIATRAERRALAAALGGAPPDVLAAGWRALQRVLGGSVEGLGPPQGPAPGGGLWPPRARRASGPRAPRQARAARGRRRAHEPRRARRALQAPARGGAGGPPPRPRPGGARGHPPPRRLRGRQRRRHQTSDYETARPDDTARKAIDRLRREAPDKETIYSVYVVDERRRLLGVLSLRDLILAHLEARVRQIMEPDIIVALVSEALCLSHVGRGPPRAP
jgi:endonuclease/exonuclease/phosphatase family metal-dependent hydrolase